MNSQIFKKPIPYLALLLAHTIWGINFVVAKVTLQEIPPMSLALLRFAFASFLLAPFFFAETKKVKIDKVDLPKLIAIGILIITLNIAFFFEGIKRTTAINASVLTLIIPGLSVLFGWWFLKEKIYLVNLAGIGLGLIGAIVILGLPQIFTGGISLPLLTGNLLIILAAVSWVLGATFSKKILKKYSALVITAISFLVGTVTMLIPALFEYLKNPGWVDQVSILGILGLIFMVLLSSISAYFLFEWGLANTSLVAANLFQYIEPVIAAVLAVIILGEIISSQFITGGACIAIGAYLGTLRKETHHPHHKAHRT